MGIDLLLKIAGVGILVSILDTILKKSGREEQAMMTSLAGLIIVLMIIIKEIDKFFGSIKSIFNFLN